MNLEQLKYALEVEKTQSLNKAAKNLFITQPALRESLNKLEDELHFKIFKRSNIGMTPTDSGTNFLREVKEVLRIIENWDKFAEDEINLKGTVEVCVIHGLYDYFVSTFLPAVIKKYPNINLLMYKKDMKSIYNAILAKKQSIILTSVLDLQISEINDLIKKNKLKMDVLQKSRLSFVVSSKNQIPANESDLKDFLRSFPLVITASEESTITSHSFNEIIHRYLSPQKIVLIDSNEATLRLIVQENAISIMSSELVKKCAFYNEALFKEIFLSHDVFRTNLVLIYPTQLSALQTRIIKLIYEYFSNN